MDTVASRWTKRFNEFFPNASGDPRTAEPSVKERPPYYLGEEWTPTAEQIEQAQNRQSLRRTRQETHWHRLERGDDYDAARAAMICASDYSVSDDAKQRYRTIRDLAFDPQAEIYVRNLRVSPDRFLIELRHPDLSVSASRPPLGIRFLGLSRSAWKSKDLVGLLLDGTSDHFRNVFASDFAHTLEDPDLAETYLRFAYDHIEFSNNEQIYIVSDRDDFILDRDARPAASGNPDAFLSAQFRVSLPPPPPADAAPVADPLLEVLKLPKDALIPPTYLRTVPATSAALAHVIIFATVVYLGRLFHGCFAVSSDGQIASVGNERRLTAEDETLPLSPIRSFPEQRATLGSVTSDAGEMVAP